MIEIYCDQFDFSALAGAVKDFAESNCTLSCEIVLADGEMIRRLNNEMRNIDSVTDVLSFPSLDGIKGKKLNKNNYPTEIDEQGNLFIGSIAICEQRAREQAEEYGHSFQRELHYLAVHGILHLLGYDHMTDADKQEMRAKEEEALAKINLTRDGE